MSFIFPTAPADAKIHLLPKGEKIITYSVSDTILLSAWLPDGKYEINQEAYTTPDEFYSRNCSGCHRNCSSYYNEYRDDFGDIDWDCDDLEGDCGVFHDGYSGQHCPEGYSKGMVHRNFQIADMVFEVELNHLGEPPRLNVVRDSAFLQKLMVPTDPSERLRATQMYMASNVFGDIEEPGAICWGYNDGPKNLRSIVSQYFSTRFNNDLLTISEFEYNCSELRSNTYFRASNVPSNTHILCGGEADAIMFLDAEYNVQGFFTMIMAGFSQYTLKRANHIMAIPLVETEITKGGNTYAGFATIPDCVGKQWFVHRDSHRSSGAILGQI